MFFTQKIKNLVTRSFKTELPVTISTNRTFFDWSYIFEKHLVGTGTVTCSQILNHIFSYRYPLPLSWEELVPVLWIHPITLNLDQDPGLYNQFWKKKLKITLEKNVFKKCLLFKTIITKRHLKKFVGTKLSLNCEFVS